MSSDTRQTTIMFLDPNMDCRILEAWVVFTLDGDTAAIQPLTLGVQGALTRYANFSHNVVAATNQVGDTEKMTLTSLTTNVAKGVPLICQRAAGASTNVSESVVVVFYEIIDG